MIATIYLLCPYRLWAAPLSHSRGGGLLLIVCPQKSFHFYSFPFPFKPCPSPLPCSPPISSFLLCLSSIFPLFHSQVLAPPFSLCSSQISALSLGSGDYLGRGSPADSENQHHLPGLAASPICSIDPCFIWVHWTVFP